jgi:RTX calcium-binding nonapeptide repeat (4 copies)
VDGERGDDRIAGGAGADALAGGPGRDEVSFLRGDARCLCQLGSTSSERGGRDTLLSIEDFDGSGFADVPAGDRRRHHIDGSGFADVLAGDRRRNHIDGNNDDVIRGRGGNDRMIGGAGTTSSAVARAPTSSWTRSMSRKASSPIRGSICSPAAVVTTGWTRPTRSRATTRSGAVSDAMHVAPIRGITAPDVLSSARIAHRQLEGLPSLAAPTAVIRQGRQTGPISGYRPKGRVSPWMLPPPLHVT